jgi:fatty acid desaturase
LSSASWARLRRRRNDSQTGREDAAALAAVPPVRRESRVMSVRRLAWPLFGLWVALTATACVLQARNGDMLEVLITPALGVLAGVGALLWGGRRTHGAGGHRHDVRDGRDRLG